MTKFWRYWATKILAVILMFIAPQIQAQDEGSLRAEDIPNSMASLGDSISAGALAAFPRQFAWNPILDFKVIVDLLIGIIGQSISIAENRTLNWSTGKDDWNQVNSHFKRLRARNKNLIGYNPATSGAVARDIRDREMPKLLSWSRKNLKQDFPDYVTLLIGANDVCQDRLDQMTPVDTFDDQINEILSELLKRSPRTKVLVSSIPKIYRLKDVAERAQVFPFPGLNQCRDLWRLLKFCPVAQLGTTPARLADVERRVRDYNATLERNVNTLRRQFGNRIRYSGGVFEHNFTANELAIDCFHPSYQGQRMLADKTWKSSWWTN